MRYVAPSKRPGRPETSPDKIRRLVHTEEARRRQADRPFDPAAPRESYARAHHFAVNSDSGLRSEIVNMMARTFYVSAWADAMEEAGERLQGELMDQAPETPHDAYEHAEKAAARIEQANGMSLDALYHKMTAMEGGDDTASEFGYCLAMMWQGSGVSWFDDHPGDDSDLDVPYGEGMIVFLGGGEFEENARGSRGAVDEHAATELVMYIENESDLSLDGPRGQGHSILLNALRKWKKGKYDSVLAVKLFSYLTESGAKRYAKEFDSERNWSSIFNVPTRTEAARQLEASFRADVEAGEYDHVNTKLGQ